MDANTVVSYPLTFYKEEDGSWFFFSPEYPGEKADLQMVAGADTMLDIYSQGESRVNLTVFTDEESAIAVKGEGRYDIFVREDNEAVNKILEENQYGGKVYNAVNTINGVNYDDFTMWLCDVTKWFFGSFPTNLYISQY